MPKFIFTIPSRQGDTADSLIIAEQPLDETTLLRVELVVRHPAKQIREPHALTVDGTTYAVRHAVLVRRADNSEVERVDQRDIQLVSPDDA